MKGCKEYHNWIIVSVGGTLPYQELDLVCEECGVSHSVSFDFTGEADEEPTGKDPDGTIDLGVY